MVLDTLGIVFFSTGSMLGFLLTALLPHLPRSWWLWPGARVIWQLGGGLWCGLAISHQIAVAGGSARAWMATPLFGALGLVLCQSALRDLLSGPLRVQGLLVSHQVQRGNLWVPLLVPHNPTIHGRLGLLDDAGATYIFKTSGRQQSRLTAMLAGVDPTRPVALSVLRYLGAPLRVEQLSHD